MTKVTQKEFKRKYKPWITDFILHKISQKNNVFKEYIKCTDPNRKPNLHKKYKALKNEVTLLTRNSKTNYYHNYFSRNKENLRKTWQAIKEIINIKSKASIDITCISNGTEYITDPTLIANKFNKFYTSIAENILKKRKFGGKKNYNDYLGNQLPNSFVIHECEENEIKHILKSLSPHKAYGPNSIPTTILHLLVNDICKPLCGIFNLSFSNGKYPDLLKVAKTIPIHKKESKLLVPNYRHIFTI